MHYNIYKLKISFIIAVLVNYGVDCIHILWGEIISIICMKWLNFLLLRKYSKAVAIKENWADLFCHLTSTLSIVMGS
jgi:hypothetical protein